MLADGAALARQLQPVVVRVLLADTVMLLIDLTPMISVMPPVLPGLMVLVVLLLLPVPANVQQVIMAVPLV